MKTRLPAAEFEDFVEGSDCKGDSIVDEDAASPSGVVKFVPTTQCF